jgi:hypothetical protein
LTGRGKLFPPFLPELFADFYLSLKVICCVLEPDPALLEETVQLVPVDPQKRSKLMLREAMGAIRLDGHVLEDDALRVGSGRDHLPCEVIGQLDGDTHGDRIHPS